MWTSVDVNDDPLLARCAEIFTQAQPSVQWSTQAVLRSAVGRGLMELFHFAGSGFELALQFQFSPRRERYLVCAAYTGSVQPGQALQALVQKAHEFIEQRQQADVYVIRPTGIPDSPLRRLCDAAAEAAGLEVETVAQTSDSEIWKVREVS